MKRCFSLLVAIALAALCACAPGQPQAPAGSQSPSQPEPSSASQPDLDPDLAAVAAEYPIRVETPERLGWFVQPVTGDREGFLLMSYTSPNRSDGEINAPQLYYCQGRTGERTLLLEGADPWRTQAEKLADGMLRVTDGKTVHRWRMGTPGEEWEQLDPEKDPEWARASESDLAWYSYDLARDTACWQDGRGRILYGDADGSQGEVIWDCQWPEPPYHTPGVDGGNPIEKWANGVDFSPSGRLAFFSEMNHLYQFHPVLYDLDTGEYREAEGEYWLENQMAEALLTDEMAVIAGHRLTEEEPVSDQLLLLSMEGPREVELDISYVRAEVTAGRLLLETENGDRYEWDPAAEECVPRGSTGFVWNGNVKVEQLLVEDGYEAIRLTLGSVSALVLQPR